MTEVRFRSPRLDGTGLVLPSVDALLDALEAGRLGPDDMVFDVRQQAWMCVREHPELRAAWVDRQRFKPRDDRTAIDRLPDARLAYPLLDDTGVTPAHGTVADDLEARRAAFRALRAGPAAAPVPAAPVRPTDQAYAAEALLRHAALVAMLLVLGLVGWSIVGLANGIGRVMSLGVWAR